MGRSWFLCISVCLALHAVLWWSLGTSQVPGFISIDCGSDDTTVYTDDNGIEWVGDSKLITEGTTASVTGGNLRVLSTMRIFDGNHSKYCYHLNNSDIQAGAAYMVRTTFWAGITPPYTPKNPDGSFRFKLIVDADFWDNVTIPYGTTTWRYSDIYISAQRSSIDVCFARSSPDGDNPFVSGLEVRPLPSTLMSTTLMLNTSRYFVPIGHADYGVPSTETTSITRYPQDPLDRLWLSYTATPPNTNIDTTSTISTEQEDRLPGKILQTAYLNATLSFHFTEMDPNIKYFAEFFFAEIDSAVNASGQRAFNILVNEQLATTFGPIDVYAAVGSNAAFGYGIVALPSADGIIDIELAPTNTSIFQPFLAAAEVFYTQFSNHVTDADTVSAVEDIKSSLNLNSYTGDPCFPIGYSYEWLTCSQDPNVTAISLSNYSTGGVIPAALNRLVLLTEIYLDGNALQGEIPDLSALTDLETLDLSNNELNGSIPEYLGTLTSLKVLDLRNNKLSGVIPATLLARKQASTLTFEFSGNSLCETNNSSTCATSPTTGTPLNTPSSKKSSSGIIIGVVVAIILLVAICIAIAVYCLCRNRPSSTLEQRLQPKVHNNSGSDAVDKVKVKPKVIREFSFEEIKIVTNNFSTLLGKGGFGPVYRGRLQDGCYAAIKVASNSSDQGSKEFLNEVDLLSRIHHKNLVGLLGYCTEGKLVLVYEFMSNGSLFDCLHGPYSNASPLSWAARLRIMVDAAQGFDYLHHGCNPKIIHRDVKSSNILLNDQLEAKISDFGISRDSFVNETGAPPTALVGSMGYMDPEYLSTMRFNERVDVYSFGVVLFEVVCGKTAFFTDSSQQQTHIVEWARSSIDRGVIDDIIDPSLHQQYDISSVWKVLDTALACVSFPGAQRPTMSTVFLELREAERMQLEGDQRNVFDKPSAEFTGGSDYNTLSYTHVNAR